LYKIQEPESDETSAEDQQSASVIEGALDKLPSGRRKATFWNAWKRRFFQAKDGYLYCHQVRFKKQKTILYFLYFNLFFILDENRTVNQKSPILFSNWLAAKLKSITT
jgi:hypothetical protein